MCELVNVLPVDRVLALQAKVCADDVLLQAEERLNGLLDTRILGGEASDEDGGRTVRVVLCVRGQLVSFSKSYGGTYLYAEHLEGRRSSDTRRAC